MWEVVESNDHNTLVDAKSFFGFVPTARIKVETPSLDQLIAVRKTLENNAHATENIERVAWKMFYKKKLKEREDKCFDSLRKTKDRLERDNEEWLAGLKHKQSEAIAPLAEYTIGSITATVTRQFRADIKQFLTQCQSPHETTSSS